MFRAITGNPTKHKRPGGNSGALAGVVLTHRTDRKSIRISRCQRYETHTDNCRPMQ
jgi:hypothetical protein